MNHLTLTEREALKLLYGNSDLAGGDIIRALIDEIETLEKDKQRLDYLIKEGCSVECGRHVGKYFLLWAEEYNACSTQIGDFDTARDAIDAALAQEQERG
jgi:hypothetical protein